MPQFPNASHGEPTGRAPGVIEELRELLGKQEFASLAEAQAFMDAHVERQNHSPVEDFCGLTPDHMQAMLYRPFNSPGVLTFAVDLEVEPSAPILTLVKLLWEAIGPSGVKATTNGNLPTKLVAEIARGYYPPDEFEAIDNIKAFNREADFRDLEIARVMATTAGVIRKYNGRFVRTAKADKVIAKRGYGPVYLDLFMAYVKRFNWEYLFQFITMSEIGFYQQSFAYSLYLLNRFGGEWRAMSEYQNLFFRAFPKVIDDIVPTAYRPAEESARSEYTRSVLSGFAHYLGLAEIEYADDPAFRIPVRIRKSELLDRVVQFHIS